MAGRSVQVLDGFSCTLFLLLMLVIPSTRSRVIYWRASTIFTKQAPMQSLPVLLCFIVSSLIATPPLVGSISYYYAMHEVIECSRVVQTGRYYRRRSPIAPTRFCLLVEGSRAYAHVCFFSCICIAFALLCFSHARACARACASASAAWPPDTFASQ